MKKMLGPSAILAFLVIMGIPLSGLAQIDDAGRMRTDKKLIVGVLSDPPFMFKQYDGAWTGLSVEIWKNVAQTLQVDYELKEMAFPDMMDALQHGKVDISIEPFYIQSDRQKIMDFSFAFGNSRLAVLTLPDKIQHPWVKALSIIFSWGTFEVLGALIFALVALGFLFWLIERRHNPDHFGGGALTGMSAGIYWVGSTLASGVCFGVALKSVAARILGLVWMLTCAIALSALIASVSNALAESRSMDDGINDETLQNMHLGVFDGSVAAGVAKDLGGQYTLFKGGSGSLMKALFSGEIDGILFDEITLDYLAAKKYPGRLSVHPVLNRRFSFAFGLPLESKLRTKVNYAIMSLMEKPEWAFLLKRYGLEQDFEVRKAHRMRRYKNH